MTLTDALQDRLASIQAEIAAADTNPHYVNRYRSEEISYWTHIPGWIAAQRRGIRVLDVGCAYGTLALFTRRLLDADVYCIDTLDLFRSAALFERAGLVFARCNIELEPCPFPGPFDLIILTEVLEHFNFHPVPTLRKIRALIADRGTLLLSTPDAVAWGRAPGPYRRLEEIPWPAPGRPWVDSHIWHYTRAELSGVLRKAGFAAKRVHHARGTVGRHFNVWAAPRQPPLAFIRRWTRLRAKA